MKILFPSSEKLKLYGRKFSNRSTIVSLKMLAKKNYQLKKLNIIKFTFKYEKLKYYSLLIFVKGKKLP